MKRRGKGEGKGKRKGKWKGREKERQEEREGNRKKGREKERREGIREGFIFLPRERIGFGEENQVGKKGREKGKGRAFSLLLCLSLT